MIKSFGNKSNSTNEGMIYDFLSFGINKKNQGFSGEFLMSVKNSGTLDFSYKMKVLLGSIRHFY
jgi:hypothetical protein